MTDKTFLCIRCCHLLFSQFQATYVCAVPVYPTSYVAVTTRPRASIRGSLQKVSLKFVGGIVLVTSPSIYRYCPFYEMESTPSLRSIDMVHARSLDP